jgi:nitroreductase
MIGQDPITLKINTIPGGSDTMDVKEAINQRRSIRAYKKDPVPETVLRSILETALRSASWANSQPWHFYIVTGKKLDEIRQRFADKADQDPYSDIDRPFEFPEPYGGRMGSISARQNEIKGIKKEDRERKGWWRVHGLKHFEAASEIYICIERSFFRQKQGLNVWPLFDCGLITQNIMLLATERGLGTIAQAQAVIYPDIIREVLEIPDSHLIVLGLAIGYPDWEDPINNIKTDRVELDGISKWYGFK